MDCSPPGSSVHGILQERILEWVAMPSSRESSQPRDIKPGLLHWQAGSLPLSHQGRPYFYAFLKFCFFKLRWYRESACHVGDLGSDLWVGRSPGGVHSNTLQYSCLENPTDRGAWRACSPWGRREDTTERLSTWHVGISVPQIRDWICVPAISLYLLSRQGGPDILLTLK